MLSKELQKAISEAIHEAQLRRHEFATVEHLLFAMLELGEVQDANLGASADCTGDMQSGSRRGSPGKDETVQRSEPLIGLVDPLLEPIDLTGNHPQRRPSGSLPRGIAFSPLL